MINYNILCKMYLWLNNESDYNLYKNKIINDDVNK